MDNGLVLACCPGCDQFRVITPSEYDGHYVCPLCGTESYTEEWIKSHKEHKDYPKYLEWKEMHPDG